MNRPMTHQELKDWANKTWNEIVNRKDIIAMAREAGLVVDANQSGFDSVECFFALVAAAEREACAKECKFGRSSADIEQAIRARGGTK